MRHIRRVAQILVVTVAAILVASFGKATASVDEADKEIREAVQQFAAAYGANALEKYFSFYAPDLTQWWPNGRRVDRETYHKSWMETIEKGGGVESAEVVDLRIHVAPAADAAVASYLLKVSRKGVPPERAKAEYQMSPTFFRRDGKWQVVHLHFSMQTPPPPATR